MQPTKTGRKLCMFSLSIAHYIKPGEPPKVSFVEVEAWDELAERNEEFKKATRVMVTGLLRQDRWEDEKGKISSRIKVFANEIRVL